MGRSIEGYTAGGACRVDGWTVVYLLMAVGSLAMAHASEAQPVAPSLKPVDYADEAKLVALLWSRSPDVVDARGAVGLAASELTRARTYPNPALDMGWGTIPVGPTTPGDLHDPIGNVPNYTVGVSELFELAKRGPRQAAAAAELEAAHAQALSTLSVRFFALLEIVGRIAKNQVRAAVAGGQVVAGQRLMELDKARAGKGDIAVVEVERKEVEHARLL